MTTPIAPGATPRPSSSAARRLATWLHPRRALQLRLLLAGPLGWLGIVYLGSLVILLLNAFWARDAFTGRVEPFAWTLSAFGELLGAEVYRTVAGRTVLMAILVTITDALLAFPIAYYMARIASPRTRAVLLIAVLMPLWAS
ncbi:MAG: ABC transporter permease, partial [Candidatus Limnocylindrales bacterium]